MKQLLVIMLLLCSMSIMAQDVIVKKDGSTIVCRVIEVTATDITYKKWSDLKGSNYVMDKSLAVSINYENGKKEDINAMPQQDNPVFTGSAPASMSVSPSLAEDNQKLVTEFNSRTLEYRGKPGKSDCYLGILKATDGSIMETQELKMDFSIKEIDYNGQTKTMGSTLVVNLFNKTNKTIYIDLANSFLINGNAHPYYIPTATSTGLGSTTGGSINAGAVAGALGVSGSAGKLASGINVGGSNTSVNRTTVFSQRIVSIPPSASITLETPQYIYEFQRHENGFKVDFKILSNLVKCQAPFLAQHNVLNDNGNYYTIKKTKMKIGEVLDLPKPNAESMSVFITYSFEENVVNTSTMRSGFYLSQLVGCREKSYKDDFLVSPNPPLCIIILDAGKLEK